MKIGIQLGKVFIGITLETSVDEAIKLAASKAIVGYTEEVRKTEYTKLEAYVLESTFVGGIHALMCNKGYKVPYNEVQTLYRELKSANEVLYKVITKYTPKVLKEDSTYTEELNQFVETYCQYFLKKDLTTVTNLDLAEFVKTSFLDGVKWHKQKCS